MHTALQPAGLHRTLKVQTLNLAHLPLQLVCLQAKALVESQLCNVRESWPRLGCSVTSDGWSSTSGRPLLNFLAVNPHGPVFLSALDTSGFVKDGDYIAEQLSRSANAVGVENVVAVITDNAPSCKSGGEILMGREGYEHITWVGCTAHCLDLLLEDIGKRQWASHAIALGKDLVKYMNNHHAAHALFRLVSAEVTAKQRAAQPLRPAHAVGPKPWVPVVLELIKPGDTRFAMALIMLERLQKVRPVLEALMVDPRWTTMVEDLPKKGRDVAQLQTDLVKGKGHHSKWWDSVKSLVDLSMPILKLLRLADSDKPTMCKIWHGVQRMRADLDAVLEHLPAAEQTAIQRCIADRCDMLISPMHGAAFMVEPGSWHLLNKPENQQACNDFDTIVQRMCPANSEQVSPLESNTIFVVW